ncbi:MAG: aminopeptidase P family protein [Thermodesulfobacteria bacterium]|nr:aminopeptidase P family protein [Thermodesulfobacteriota bacterium]
MEASGIDVVLLRQNADLFYFTGTVQDAHLLIPSKGQAHYLVWRSYDRALQESPLAPLGLIQPLKGLSHFAEIVRSLHLDEAAVVGLEMDVLPAGLFLFYKETLWPKAEIKDISPHVRKLRSIKDDGELKCISGAAQRVHKVLERVPEFFYTGMTELELAALVECELRKMGHCGLLRMRIWNQEMGMDQVVSGKSALSPSWTNTPVGGVGPHPAFGMGASFKKIGMSEVVSVDIGGWYCGYCCDITRPFFVGQPSSKVVEVFDIVKELMGELERRLVPGAITGEIYQYATDFMAKAGYGENFMGVGQQRVSFIGHGLGIELDEFPFISRGNKMTLESGMVVALEPKVMLPEYGVVGLEDTYLITRDGGKRLTIGEQRLGRLEI